MDSTKSVWERVVEMSPEEFAQHQREEKIRYRKTLIRRWRKERWNNEDIRKLIREIRLLEKGEL